MTHPIRLSALLICGALSLTSLSACQNDTRQDELPSAGQEQALAAPPGQDEPFYAPKAMPSGPKPVQGYDPDLVGARFADDGSPLTNPSRSALPSDDAAAIAASATTEGIPRAALQAFTRQGPRRPLELLQVQPAFQGSRFIGYRVMALNDEGARHFGAALRPGDVVLSVNKRAIASPEEYMAAWNSLKDCDELSVKLIRGEETVELSWPVTEAKPRETSKR